MSGATLEIVKAGEAGVRLDRWIKRRVQLSQGQVEKLIRTGQVRVDGSRAKSNTRLTAGQEVRLPPFSTDDYRRGAEVDDRPKVNSRDTGFIRGLVLYQDDELIALNKPAGIAVQGGTKQGRHIDGMLGALADEHGQKPKLVHRLDRDTSGVLVLGKTPSATARLGEDFRSREMDKVYWAITVGVPNPRAGQLRSWMVKGTGPGEDREKMQMGRQGQEGARHAITDYSTVSTAAQRAAWVALKPLTGRTHQLRFHLQELGTSILGDRKYATAREVPGGVGEGLHLHARGLIIPKPNGRDVVITAPLPPHMEETFSTLGFLIEEAGNDILEPFA